MPTAQELMSEADNESGLSKVRSTTAMPKTTHSEIKKSPFITGDFAKTQSANLAVPKKSASDLMNEADTEASFGYTKARPVAIQDPDTVDTVLSQKKSASDLMNEADQEATPGTKAYQAKHGSPILRGITNILSFDENVVVKGLYKATGFDKKIGPKADLSDYTYTTMLKDMGFADDVMTDAAGLVLSIFGSPSTYLSFGTGGIIRGVTEGGLKVGLTKEGESLVNGIIKTQVEKDASLIESKLGRALVSDERNKLTQDIAKNVNSDVVKKFSEIKTASEEGIHVHPDVDALSEKVFDSGGIKWAGYTLIDGKTVADKFKGVGEALDGLRKRETLLGGITDSTLKGVEKSNKFFKTLFVPNSKQEKELVGLYQDTALNNASLFKTALEEESKFYTGLTEAQRLDFGKSALTASRSAEKILSNAETAFKDINLRSATNTEKAELTLLAKNEHGEVKSLSGDPAVQKKLDEFYGQGPFAGKKSIADKFAELSQLSDEGKIPIWFPQIDKFRKIEDIRPPTDLFSESERAFLRQRKAGTNINDFWHDPAYAMTYRRMEVAFANVQDQMYENAVKNKMGGLLTLEQFVKLPEAEKNAYQQFRRLPTIYNEEKRIKDAQVFVRSEFADGYSDMLKRKTAPDVPILSWATDLFKRSVTTVFPAFHARNFNSNIVLNAMSIGRQAFSPRLHSLGLDIVRGKNLEKEFVTQIGEKLSLKDLTEEAKALGVIKDTYVDLGGENLDKAAQATWQRIVSTANPLSKDFGAYKLGKRFGSAIEGQARMVNYLAWREKGLSAKLAAIEVNEALFDYSAVTNFEKWANLVTPFYTFSKKNLEAQMKLFAYRPGAIGAQLKAMRDLGPSDKEWEQLPEWAKTKYVAKLKGNMLTGFGLPLEDVLEVAGGGIRGIFMRLNPVAKYVYETSITERDTYTGRKLVSLNSAKEFKWAYDLAHSKSAPEPVKAIGQEIVDHLKLERDVHDPKKIIGDPDMLHILRNSFTSRYQSTIGMLSDPDKSANEAAVRALLGVVRIPKNLSRELSYFQTKSAQRMLDAGVKTNAVRELEVPMAIGGDPMSRKIVNYYLQNSHKTGSIKEGEKFEAEAIKEFEKEQKLRGGFH